MNYENMTQKELDDLIKSLNLEIQGMERKKGNLTDGVPLPWLIIGIIAGLFNLIGWVL